MGLLDESGQAALLKVACSIEVPEQVLIDVRDCSDAIRREATKNLVVRRKKTGRTSDANYAISRTRGAIEFLTELISDVAPDEKKFFGILEKAFSKEEYALLAAAAGREVETTAQKLRSLMASGSDSGITLFFPADGELESFTVKSMSYTGPTPPPGVTVPKGRKGNATHILSLDLSAFPTLAERAGGETLSLFVESPDTGEFNDDAALVALSKLASIPEGGRPLQLGSLELPAKLRRTGRSQGGQDLKRILRGCQGHAFGPAYWIQRKHGNSVTLQLNDAYMNLGDAGSLYIGDFGTTWQCH